MLRGSKSRNKVSVGEPAEGSVLESPPTVAIEFSKEMLRAASLQSIMIVIDTLNFVQEE